MPKPGDVIRLTQPSAHCNDFRDQWGNGPFILDQEISPGRFTIFTMDEVPITQSNSIVRWNMNTQSRTVAIDEFLTMVRKTRAEKGEEHGTAEIR